MLFLLLLLSLLLCSAEQFNADPVFLKELPNEVRDEFADIIRNKELAGFEKHRQLTGWAQKANVEKEYQEWHEKIEEQKRIVNEDVGRVVANMTEVYSKLTDILMNDNATRLYQEEKLSELSTTFPREVRALFFIARHYQPDDTAPIYSNDKKDNGFGIGYENIYGPTQYLA